MLDKNDVLSTVQMIDRQHLDIRTITMGISLLSCADRDAKAACEKIYDKITRYAEGLVKTGEDIEREFGIPIVNKRISVTPIALVAAASEAPATRAMGVTEMRLLTMGMPNSCSMSSPVRTSFSAYRVIFS